MLRLQSTIALAAFLALSIRCAPHGSPVTDPVRPTTSPAEETEQVFLSMLAVEAAEVPLYAEASRTAPVVETLRSGDRLRVIEGYSDWVFVQSRSGVRGYVQPSSLVSLECTRDKGEPFPLVTPIFRFSEEFHGKVVVEAEYDEQARLLSVRVVENTVGDARFEQHAIDDLRRISFFPPTEDCEPRAFIYTFTRQF